MAVAVWSDPRVNKSDMVRQLHSWWADHCFDADAPDRSAFEPDQMKRLLPFLFICDAEHDPFRVRYRLVGTRAVEVAGKDVTGRYLDELGCAKPDQPWVDHFSTAYESRRPLLGATTVPTSSGRLFTYEFGIFPLRKGSRAISQFIVIEDYFGLISQIIHVEPWRATKPSAHTPYIMPAARFAQ